MAATSLSNARANRRVGLIAALAAIAMIGVAYASVPLYRLFCQVTGWGGTTQRAVEAPTPVPGKSISDRFDSKPRGGLPWPFRPAQQAVPVETKGAGKGKSVCDSVAPRVRL